MENETIYKLIDMGHTKYRYIHKTFDKTIKGSWMFKIKQYCLIFHHFKIYRNELEIMVNNLNKEIIKRTTEIAERIARDLIPEIAERVIKEEIEKLKKMSNKE